MVAVILAGGENKRIPVLKGFIEINGRRIIETQLSILRKVFEKVFISANSPELYFGLGAPLTGDLFSQRGPLTGILSALVSTGEDEIFALACDMPFINPELIGLIVENRGDSATVPVYDGRPEPLLSIYSKDIINSGLRRLKEGKPALKGLLDEINVKYINEDAIRAIDPDGRSFVNINTQAELETIKMQENILAFKGNTSPFKGDTPFKEVA